MVNTLQWSEVVKRLAEETTNGRLKWNPSPNFTRDDATSDIFVAVVTGRMLVCFEYRYQHYTDADEWHWENEIAIEFVEPDGSPQWRLPKTPFHWQLMEAIKYRASGAEEFIKSFLGK